MLGEKRRADCLRSNLQRKFGLAPTPLRLCKTPVGVPSGTPGLPRSLSRDINRRRQQRIQLVVDPGRHGGLLYAFCSQRYYGDQLQQSPCVRSSVALPPGIGNEPHPVSRPAELCKEKPSLRVPSGTGASRGAAAGPNGPKGRNCPTGRPRNCSAQQFLSARLFPHSRLVETGGRRYPARQAAIRRSTRRDCVFR